MNLHFQKSCFCAYQYATNIVLGVDFGKYGNVGKGMRLGVAMHRDNVERERGDT